MATDVNKQSLYIAVTHHFTSLLEHKYSCVYTCAHSNGAKSQIQSIFSFLTWWGKAVKTVHTSGLLRPACSNSHPVMLRHFLSHSSLAQTAALAELCGKHFWLYTETNHTRATCKILSGHQTFLIRHLKCGSVLCKFCHHLLTLMPFQTR